AKRGEIEGSDDRFIAAQLRIVRLGLVLQERSHTDPRFQGPFHMGDKPRAWEPLLSSACDDRLDQRTYPKRIEGAITQMDLWPITQLELAALLGGRRIDPGFRQPREVGVTARGTDHMKALLAARNPLVDERQQHAVFFLMTVKERADMP